VATKALSDRDAGLVRRVTVEPVVTSCRAFKFIESDSDPAAASESESGAAPARPGALSCQLRLPVRRNTNGSMILSRPRDGRPGATVTVCDSMMSDGGLPACGARAGARRTVTLAGAAESIIIWALQYLPLIFLPP
jgi:hypothetical protein